MRIICYFLHFIISKIYFLYFLPLVCLVYPKYYAPGWLLWLFELINWLQLFLIFRILAEKYSTLQISNLLERNWLICLVDKKTDFESQFFVLQSIRAKDILKTKVVFYRFKILVNSSVGSLWYIVNSDPLTISHIFISFEWKHYYTI